MKKKKTFQKILMILIILLAFYLILKDDAYEILKNLSQISFYEYLPILLLGSSFIWLSGFILYRIEKAYRPVKKIDGVLQAYIQTFFNGVTPLGGGQVALSVLLKKEGFEASEIASILWKDFFYFQSGMLITVMVLLLGSIEYGFIFFPSLIYLVFLGFFMNTMVIAFLWGMSYFPKLDIFVTHHVLKFLFKIHIIKDITATTEKLHTMIHEFSINTQLLKKEKTKTILFILMNSFKVLVSYAMPYFVALLMRLDLQPVQLIEILVLSGYQHMLNALTPLPGDMGWGEGTFVLLFMTLFSKSEAASLMILWRFATFYFPVLTGGIVLLISKYKNNIIKL